MKRKGIELELQLGINNNYRFQEIKANSDKNGMVKGK